MTLGIVASAYVETVAGTVTPTVVEAVAANYSSTRSPTVTFTTSPVEDDVIVAVIGSTTAAALTADLPPTGWSNCLNWAGEVVTLSDGSATAAVVYHTVTAAEDVANTVAWTLTNLWAANEIGDLTAICLRGADTAAVVDAAAAWSDPDLVTPHILPRIGAPGEVELVAVNFPTTAAATTLAVPLPTDPLDIATGDILLLHVETANQAVTLSDTAGGTWTEVVTPAGVGTAGSTGATRATVLWSRYNGTQTAPTIANPGDHTNARMSAWRGALASGNPFDVAAAGTDAAGPTTLTVTGVTTTVDLTTVIHLVSDDLDTGAVRQSAQTNANLVYTTESYDGGGTSGNGGGVCAFHGVKATAGATGNSTLTQTATVTVNSWVVAALKSAGAASGVAVTNGLVLRAAVCDGLTTYTTPAGHTQRVTSNTNQGVWLGTRDTAATAATAVAATDITPTGADEYASITLVITPA